MLPKSYKKVYFFYFFISNIQNTSSFSEANPAIHSKLAPQKLFFLGKQRASVGRCC
jgi:hypothetical protein